MRQTLKISLALLVSLAVFAVFAVIAFTGLFDLLQVTFFQPRVLREREKSLGVAAELIERYHRLNLERFIEPLKQPYMISAFSAFGQESREDIFNRLNYFGKLLDEYPALQGVRFISSDGKIQFSTFPGDAKSREKDQIRYYAYQEVEKGEKALPASALLVPRGGSPQLLIDGQASRFVYSLPTSDPKGGTAVFYFSKSGLADALLVDPRLDFRELALIDRLGVMLNVPESEKDLIAPVVVKAWSRRAGPGLASDTVVLSGEGGVQEKQILLSLPAGPSALVGWLVPYTAFELQPLMKAVILTTVLLTVFLLVFFLFNLRQDPLLVLSQRIKRFQLEILQELIESRKELDWRRWRDELAGGRSELGSRIKRGIGRLPAGKEVEIDDLIDRSWDEIIRIIEARIGQGARERVDIGVIEELIQKALERGRITLEMAAPVASLPAVAPPLGPPVAPLREALQVEEIGVEEVTEAAEVEAAQAAQAEAQEAVEELQEAEAVEEAEEAYAEGAPEAAEEAVWIGPSLEAGESPAALEALEAEEAEAVEELAAEEVTEQAPAAAAEMPSKLPPAQPEGIAEEAEVLEELAQVSEIKALPPEPQEQLEELPVVQPPSLGPGQPARPSTVAEMPAELRELEAEEAEPEELEGLEEEPKVIAELLESKEPLEIETAPEQGLPSLEELLGKGLIRVYSSSEVEALVAESRSSVVMENGVYRIKEELVAGSAPAKVARTGKGLRALAEQVLSASGKPQVIEEEPGISELLGSDFGVDLAAELEGLRSKRGETRIPDRKRFKRIRFFGQGLDYDQFLGNFGDGSSDSSALESLVEVSRKIQAVSAVILMEAGQSFDSVLRVGLMEKPATIRFAAGEPFYDRLLKQHQTVLILERPASIPGLAGKFHPEDQKYMQGALFLPAVYQSVPAYLFLGLPSRRGLELKEIIARLEIY